MEEENIDYILKIVLLGDSAVGKTNLLSQYRRNTFLQDSKPTIGVEFSSMDIVRNGKKIKAQFWDTAGEEKYRAMAESYYRNSHGAFVVYDITNE